MDVSSNVVMANLSKFLSFGFFLRKRQIREAVTQFIKLLDIRTPSATQEVRLLSGGNQQKIVVAKWLGARLRHPLLRRADARHRRRREGGNL